MTVIHQPPLYDIDFLEKLDIQERYLEIFSPLEWDKLLSLFDKETRVGPPVKTNYQAVLRSLLARFYEKIPTQTDLLKRLKSDVRFKLSVGFLYSQAIPSASTYSRVMAVLSENLDLLETINQDLLQLVHEEFEIFE